MWNVITLDGYFEGEKNWDLSFHDLIWGDQTERLSIEQLNNASHLVFGRVTYEGMAAYWKSAEGTIASLMNEIPKIVCSTTLNTVDWHNTTLIKENIAAKIKKLKAAYEKDLYVFGSANLSETLISENLFDEYRICIAPIILGKGRLLFAKGMPEQKLSMISSEPLTEGGIILKYIRKA